MIDPIYRSQVDLLLRILPYVAEETCFALKGGTAINLFIRNMPRLSVDIDLVYLPLSGRDSSLLAISQSLVHLQQVLISSIPGISVGLIDSKGHVSKLLCRLERSQVKIEVNTIMRGHIRPTRFMPISEVVQKEFSKFAAIQVVSDAELFGGKICAALDRQHPRDLFDIFYLLNNEGITEEIKDGFLVALLSHPRPICELLHPNFIDQRQTFNIQFHGMTVEPFRYEDFEQARLILIQSVLSLLTRSDKKFLLGFKNGNPDWTHIDQLQDLPAIQWKLRHIRHLCNLDSDKHLKMVEKLERILFT